MNDSTHVRGDWTRHMGLTVVATMATGTERLVGRARRDYLTSVRPTEFIRTTEADDVRVPLEQVVAELEAIETQCRAAVADESLNRRARGWAMVRGALAASDAEVPINIGDWTGFTRGRAIAWCWNLYQFEPHGFVHPGSQLRAERIAELEAGPIPDGFGYAGRATQLESAGMTPETYRQAMDALDKPTFDPGDVRF